MGAGRLLKKNQDGSRKTLWQLATSLISRVRGANQEKPKRLPETPTHDEVQTGDVVAAIIDILKMRTSIRLNRINEEMDRIAKTEETLEARGLQLSGSLLISLKQLQAEEALADEEFQGLTVLETLFVTSDPKLFIRTVQMRTIEMARTQNPDIV